MPLNQPHQPATFCSPNNTNNVDLTLASEPVEKSMSKWEVRNNKIDSDLLLNEVK